MLNRLIICLISLILLILQSSIIFAQEDTSDILIKNSETITMRKCINIALLNNPDIKMAMSDSDIFKTRIGQAKSAYIPELDFSGGYNYGNTASYISLLDNNVHTFDITSVGLTQLIYDFGKTTTNIKIQKKNFNSSLEDLQNTINNTVFNVKQAYFNLLLAYETKHVYEEAVEMYKEQLKQAEAFYKVGERPKVDVLTARVNLSNAKLDLIKAQNDVEVAKAELNNVMGLPEAPDYELTDELKFSENKLNFDTLLDTAIENRPDYKSALLKTDSAKLQIRLAKTNYAPRIEAFGNYMVNGYSVNSESSTDSGWNIGARLNFTAYNIYLNKKRVDEAKATYDKEIFTSEKLKNQIYLEVEQAYAGFVESQRGVPVAEVAVIEAKENYDITNGRYKVGFGNHIEVKDAELYYVNAKLAYYQTLYYYNLSIAVLERFIGQELSGVNK